PGQWLLTLPHDHIAGIQVCARSLLSGYTPVFHGEEPLHVAIQRMDPKARRYTSLVPTQLVRIMSEEGPDLAALRELDGILVGGSAIDPTLLDQARTAGLPIHTTYGSTETAGGCVYDGKPLPGVVLNIDDDGRILLGGPTLAWGYLDDGPDSFITTAGRRWFRTSDIGTITTGPDPELTVIGRADDVIITGGINVHPVAVEHAIREIEGVADCVAVGIPSMEWGAEIIAVVVPRRWQDFTGDDHKRQRQMLLEKIRSHTKQALEPACAPRGLVVTMRLPTRGPGKIDRNAAADLALTVLAAGEGTRYTP
ncbi:MAG TPA: AMP-binding protein, partial [Beutenbergiaceae bacterium]|nr:AMP-binding protein [Beutenbergiaceae bacterium]